ncbi:gluconate 2-dehydrogenase subunit 3 family protein [Pelagibacterium sp. H642]|uniref:gluconate 2-dehydrogenase subunit 3 family protein n=1 Tax=Pelagibacterium sp. H642 TaxID=1881069 RepID=UPI0028157EA7|nr:gluconate 2-dehydrogenase subunit 3 family protein [Pelagibacterium sp. H642]WMT89222.1 gluconate 2-dehydrogenase subunit 3 family protein [Pelagibacterium sp. H642]
MMNRRDLLKLITAATGMSLIGGTIVTAQELFGPQSDTGRAFGEAGSALSDEEIAFLNEVAEVILPRTDTPGAKEADVATFMSAYVADVYSADERETFLTAVPEISARSQDQFGKDFLDLTKDERLTLVSELDEEARAAASSDDPHYFTMVKQLTLLGFFTSEVGATQALRYEAVPGGYDGCAVYEEGQPAWATG